MHSLRKILSSQGLSNHRDPKEPRFEVGAFLRLKILPTTTSSSRQHVLNVEILKLFFPFTMSCVMVVWAHDPANDLKGNFVLKLYDRRFKLDQREESDMHQWSSAVDLRYRTYTLDREHLVHYVKQKKVCDDENWHEEFDEWNEAQQETYEDHLCHAMYESELEVYRRLEDLQGADVPSLLARVELPDYYTSKYANLDRLDPHSGYNVAVTPGLLLQYMPDAFSLQYLYEAKLPPPHPKNHGNTSAKTQSASSI